jgi:hypothetical protein
MQWTAGVFPQSHKQGSWITFPFHGNSTSWCGRRLLLGDREIADLGENAYTCLEVEVEREYILCWASDGSRLEGSGKKC